MDLRQKQINEAVENAYYANTCAQQPMAQSVGIGIQGCYRPSPAEEAEKQAADHFERGSKAQRAAEFLRKHPEFDEFIQLIRQGVIGI